MKNFKFLIPAILLILLPSCINNSSTSQDNNISEDTRRLNNIVDSQNNYQSNNPTDRNIRFPAGGNNISGEKITKEADNSQSNIEEINTPLNENQNLLATYSSKVYTKTEDRQRNLRIVCEKLTGTILKPNEEFSYNETCGPYNKENGFGKATVFLGDGTEAQDYGGGVCQLSSTLYNAVKDLNIEITERHLHSKKVYYVPDGQDATVSYGNLDFKFKNLNNYSLLIEAFSNADFVKVNVYKI